MEPSSCPHAATGAATIGASCRPRGSSHCSLVEVAAGYDPCCCRARRRDHCPGAGARSSSLRLPQLLGVGTLTAAKADHRDRRHRALPLPDQTRQARWDRPIPPPAAPATATAQPRRQPPLNATFHQIAIAQLRRHPLAQPNVHKRLAEARRSGRPSAASSANRPHSARADQPADPPTRHDIGAPAAPARSYALACTKRLCMALDLSLLVCLG